MITSPPRAIHFQNGAAAAAAPDPESAAAERNDILTLGRARAAADLLRQQLAHLLNAETDYHGTLQVCLSKSQQMVDYMRDLIRSYEERNL